MTFEIQMPFTSSVQAELTRAAIFIVVVLNVMQTICTGLYKLIEKPFERKEKREKILQVSIILDVHPG
jgi:peptidoglycan/LPS O-acetylase OafA/YrhL